MAKRAALAIFGIILASDILGYLSMLIGPSLYPRLQLGSTLGGFLVSGGLGWLGGWLVTRGLPRIQEARLFVPEEDCRTVRWLLLSMVIVWAGIRRIVFESCFFLSSSALPGCFAVAHASRTLATGLACGMFVSIYKWTLDLERTLRRNRKREQSLWSDARAF